MARSVSRIEWWHVRYGTLSQTRTTIISYMAQHDPVDRNLLRMELRRFQTRSEAQEGTIQRADTVREVARLATLTIPFPLSEETAALDARLQVRRTAEQKARDLLETLFDQLVKAEPVRRDKLRRTIQEEFLQLTGPLVSLRIWAQGRLNAVEQMLPDQH